MTAAMRFSLALLCLVGVVAVLAGMYVALVTQAGVGA